MKKVILGSALSVLVSIGFLGCGDDTDIYVGTYECPMLGMKPILTIDENHKYSINNKALYTRTSGVWKKEADGAITLIDDRNFKKTLFEYKDDKYYLGGSDVNKVLADLGGPTMDCKKIK